MLHRPSISPLECPSPRETHSKNHVVRPYHILSAMDDYWWWWKNLKIQSWRLAVYCMLPWQIKSNNFPNPWMNDFVITEGKSNLVLVALVEDVPVFLSFSLVLLCHNYKPGEAHIRNHSNVYVYARERESGRETETSPEWGDHVAGCGVYLQLRIWFLPLLALLLSIRRHLLTNRKSVEMNMRMGITILQKLPILWILQTKITEGLGLGFCFLISCS